jgi:tetratricopeptide (TPR) repeat protein
MHDEAPDDPANASLAEADALAEESLAARNAGDLDRALDRARRCHALREAALGELHADTAAALGLLAAAWRRRGELDAALVSDQRALEIYEHVLGDSHPDTATAAGNLSATRRMRGELDAALALAERALAGLTAACGADDPRTAVAWGNLAAVRRARGEHAEALACGRELLRIREAALGATHLDTATAHSNLGALLAASGDHAGAEVQETQALAIREASGDARATLESLGNLAAIYRNLGDAARSLEFQQRVLTAQRELLGEAHPATTRSRLYIAYIFLRLGRRLEAQRLIDEGLRHDPRDADLRNLKDQVDRVAQPGFRSPAATKAPLANRSKPRGRGKR